MRNFNKKLGLLLILSILSIGLQAQNDLNGEWMLWSGTDRMSSDYTAPDEVNWKTVPISGTNSSYTIPCGNFRHSFSKVEDNLYKGSFCGSSCYLRVKDFNHAELVYSDNYTKELIRKNVYFYDEVGDFDKAIELMKYYLSQDKKNISYLNTLAWFQIKNKNFEDALSNLEYAIKRLNKKPDEELLPFVQGNLAHAYLFTNNYDKAIELYNKNAVLTYQNTPWFFYIIRDFKTFNKLGFNYPNLDKAIEELISKYSFNLGTKNFGFFYDKRDKQIYQTVKIGNQIWFAQNFRYKSDKSLTYKEKFENDLGRYYNYYDAINSCPDGWHLPSDYEWKILEKNIGMLENDINLQGFVPRGENEKIGKLLVESGEIMFYAKYSGLASQTDKSFKALNENGQYWTNTKSDEINAYIRVFSSANNSVIRDITGTGNYLTVRYIRDLPIEEIVLNDTTLTRLTNLIKNNPSDADIFYKRSIEFLRIGEYKYSLDDINKAIQLSDKSDYQLFKAQILYLTNFEANKDEVVKILENYISNNTQNDFAWYFLTLAYVYEPTDIGLNFSSDNQILLKALNSIEKAINLDSKNIYFLHLKSKILFAQKDYQKVISNCETELKLDETNPEIYYLLAMSKLNFYDKENRNNRTSDGTWCTFTGKCYKLSQDQLSNICEDLQNAKKYGIAIDLTPYEKLCGDLRATELYQMYSPKIYIGPRGGRYMINNNGNKVYLPKN